jgi:hypothetical protein
LTLDSHPVCRAADENDYEKRMLHTFDFIEECGFNDRSRLWKKADFFTAFVELDNALHIQRIQIDPSAVLEHFKKFYDSVDGNPDERSQISEIYYKSALQALNDRVNRIRRGMIISGIIVGKEAESINNELRDKSLL